MTQQLHIGGLRPFDYDPPVVRWIQEDRRAHPEPPPDPSASDLDALRYDAALTEARCGIDCRIGQINGPGVYDYAVSSADGEWGSSGNCGTYWEARQFLRGVECGAKAAKGAQGKVEDNA